MQQLRKYTDQKDAAHRERVEQARREQPNAAYLANILERAGELAIGGYLKESAAMSSRYIQETQG